MGTQNSGGSTVEFGNAAKAQPDFYSVTEDAAGVDGTNILLLDVTSNDSMTGGASLYSVDDGRVSSPPVHGGDADLLTKDTVYSDASAADLLAADSLTTDTSLLGAKIWITADGQVAYDTSSPAIEALAQGQTATDSFVYAIRSGNELYWTTVTLTVTGVNDAPVLSAGAALPPISANPISGSDAAQGETAMLTFTDVDLIDTHSASLRYVGAALSGGQALPSGLDGILASDAQAVLETDSTNGGAGVIAVPFLAASKTFDFLSQGQTLTVAYAVTVTDNWGASSTLPVTFTITGTNHIPVFSAPWTAAPAIVEAANTTGSTAPDSSSATLTFTDTDPADTHTTGVSYVGASWLGGAFPLPSGLDSVLASAATSALVHDSTNGATGAIDFNFSAPDSAFDFLGEGQTLTVTYAVSVTDTSGAGAAETVAVTITGTNDAPVLSADAGGPHAFTDGTPSTPWGNDEFGATLAFTDPDRLYDFHSVSLAAPAFAWSGSGAPATLSTAELNALNAAFGGALHLNIAQDTNLFTPAGDVSVSFAAPDYALDFLAAGQTVTVTYDVAVTDSHGGVSNVQPVTVTVTGTNEAPYVYGYGVPLAGPGDGIAAFFFDPDFTDIHTASLSLTGAQWSAGGALPSGLDLLADAAATVAQDSTDGNSGEVDVALNTADPMFAFLAEGESLAVSYNLTIDDGHGGKDVVPVGFEVTGANDAPVLAADPLASHPVSGEQAGVTGSSAPDMASATLDFTDPDLTDTHTVTIGTPTVAWSGVGLPPPMPVGLTDALAPANALTLTRSDSTGTGSGSVGLAFSVADSSFDFLAAGETLTVTYNVMVTDNHGLASSQPVAFTITGANDAPVLAPIGGLTFTQIPAPGGYQADWGAVQPTFTDADLSDTHTVSASDPTIVWSGGSTPPAGLANALSVANALSLQGPYSLQPGLGDVSAAFVVPDGTFDFLGQGETLTITYAITVADNHGGSSTQPFTVTVNGVNDAPQITTVQNGAITELAGKTGDTTDIDTGTAKALFTDPDLNDTHANPTVTFAGAFGANVTPALLAALAADPVQASLIQDSTGGGAGEVDVTLSAPDNTFDFLSAGQTLTVQYNVTVTDNHGLSTTRAVDIVVTGTNDVPVLGPDTAGPHTVSEEAGRINSSDVDVVSATLTYTDPDLSDLHTFSAPPPQAIVWSGGAVTPHSLSFSVSFASHDSNGTGSGSVTINFSGVDKQFDFLAQGETLTFVNNLTVKDNHGGSSITQPVTFVIVGTNDAPVLAADTVASHAVSGQPLAVTGQSTPDSGFATLKFTDVDYNDTHTASATLASAVLSTGGALPDGLQEALSSALQTSVADSTHSSFAAGSVLASFSAPDSAFDFLGAGQTLTVTYDVTVSDNHGLSSTQAVTFVVDGANYTPIFAATGSDNLTGTATADEFVFSSPVGADTISAFDPTQDVVDLIGFGFSSFADLQPHMADDAAGDAVITLAGGETITLSGVSTASLGAADFLFDQTPSVFNAGTMTIADDASQILGGQVVNSGVIALGSTGDPTALDIAAMGATLTGGGQLTLSDSTQNLISGSSPTVVLTNVDNTISGAGRIGGGALTLVNRGMIDANGTNALVIDTGSNTVVNSGVIEATGAGGLTVNSALNDSGDLVANGGGLHLMGAVTGSGLASIFGSSTIEFGAASSEAVNFGLGAFGMLKLDDPTEFTGLISGFRHGNSIDLAGIAPSATITTSLSGGPAAFTTAVTINDGAHIVHLALAGIFTVGLHLTDDHLGGSLVGYL